MPPRHDVG